MSNENVRLWSPFDPVWYKDAFDKFISTSEELFNAQDILEQGYTLNDADGSRSSVFRNEAVLNDSFNEESLRETLRNIYDNSSHKLVASNHDNVHFFQYGCKMSDLSITSESHQCELVIPTDSFIRTTRERYKFSKYFEKWISYEDLMDNWDVFNFICLLFINQRCYVDFSIYLSEQETKIRFRYFDSWVNNDYPVYIYKFDTNYHTMIQVSRHQLNDLWNYKIPADYINDSRVTNYGKFITIIHRSYHDREDDVSTVYPMCDNVEFLNLSDGYLDLNNVSDANMELLNNDRVEWINISLICPKFLHEFPMNLPVDVLYRSQRLRYSALKVLDNGEWHTVKVDNDDPRNVLAIHDETILDYNEGWQYTIRPLVLSDANVKDGSDFYAAVRDELNNIKILRTHAADEIETFHNFIYEYTTDDEFLEHCDTLEEKIGALHTAHNQFLSKRFIGTMEAYDERYDEFLDVMVAVREKKASFKGFSKQFTKNDDFWSFVSPLVTYPNVLLERYHIITLLDEVNKKRMWESYENNTLRFKHPVESSDFWTFEYDADANVWRPYMLNIERQYPDVYLLSDPGCSDCRLNSIYKAFVFYSDTMNIREESKPVYRPTANWDEDMKEYTYEYGATYRDIFMEKFYWMGLKTLYSGILCTNQKWEVIEYVRDNKSYERFNKLFLETMDPYFKMGLATYLKSSDYNFPFDDAIHKMEESINTKFLGYNRIANFERYIDETWAPAYFDYVTRVLDDFDYFDRFVKRPRPTFDIRKFVDIMNYIQTTSSTAVNELVAELEWLNNMISMETYNLDARLIVDSYDKVVNMQKLVDAILEYINELDMQIYDIGDVDHIIDMLETYQTSGVGIVNHFTRVRTDAYEKNVHEEKAIVLNYIDSVIKGDLCENLDFIKAYTVDFSIENFMKLVNDPEYFGTTYDEMQDRSLIGLINRFRSAWNDSVKDVRNTLYVQTATFYSLFTETKTSSTLESMLEYATAISETLEELSVVVPAWWEAKHLEEDGAVTDGINDSKRMIDGFVSSISVMNDKLGVMNTIVDDIRTSILGLHSYYISEAESVYIDNIDDALSAIIIAVASMSDTIEDDIDNAYASLITNSADLLTYNEEEKSVFDKIFEITDENYEFFAVQLSQEEIVAMNVEYLKTLDEPFVPSTNMPNYSTVYRPTEIEIVVAGFHYNVDDLVFVPEIGVYKVTSVDGALHKVTAITDTDYRNTSFNNPKWKTGYIFDTISDNGAALSIKVLQCDEIKIINDSIVGNYNERIDNIVDLVRVNILLVNPYANTAANAIVTKIEALWDEWNEILGFYSDYMSQPVIDRIMLIFGSLTYLKTKYREFITTRSGNDLSSLIGNLSSFSLLCYNYMYQNNMLTPTFNYFHNRLQDVINEARRVYGNGTTWNDADEIYSLLDTIDYEIKLYRRKALVDIYVPEIIDPYNALVAEIISVRESIDNTISQRDELSTTCDTISDELSGTYELHVDKWFELNYVGIAEAGTGYATGDIVEIIPELPIDYHGEVIHDDEDIILNDKIVLQVTEVNEDGSVRKVVQLMNYAIPYPINGSRRTITRTGHGDGLVVQYMNRQIEISDSTLFLDQSSDDQHPNIFDKNDMFVFNFENTYDLNISYEVFNAGKQIHDFVIRHDYDDARTRKVDKVYLNANDVYGLRNSSIYVNRDNYLVYKLDDIEIIDPGAGYAEGQEIIVDAGETALRLKVLELTSDPTRGISKVEPVEGYTMFNGLNPESDNATAVDDSMNNIDDEYNSGYYDKLTQEGENRGVSRVLDKDEYPFVSHRFDDIEGGSRNKSYLYNDEIEAESEGDPDEHFYLGSEHNKRYNRIMNTQPPTDPFITDEERIPPIGVVNGEYQEICRERICTVFPSTQLDNDQFINGDLVVQNVDYLPTSAEEWPEVNYGKCVVIASDNRHGNHRTIYRVRGFILNGKIIYDEAEIVDEEWRSFNIDWSKVNYFPDMPTLKALYPDTDWDTKSFMEIQREIADGKHEAVVNVTKYFGTYIDNVTVDDLSVWNYTTKQWEDLHDDTKWELIPNENGFELKYLEDGEFSYDMILYLNKIPATQMKNEGVKRNAVFKVKSRVYDEVTKKASYKSINVGRDLRIRKLFPYHRTKSYLITNFNNTMVFNVGNYIHFRNEIHLKDIKLFNKTADRYENILNTNMFDVYVKDSKAVSREYETQTNIVRCIISTPGTGFVNGYAWCWNAEYECHVFVEITADMTSDGHLVSITPLHAINPPKDNVTLEFAVLQHTSEYSYGKGFAIIGFTTEKVRVYGDGWIHNVTNPNAVIKEGIKIICKYNLINPIEYEVRLSMTSRTWEFIKPDWEVFPTFHIDDQLSQDHLYISTDTGRIPLVNPATGKPSMVVDEVENGTNIKFLNLYNRYERFVVHSVPYSMRSVFTQRRIPSNGYVDVAGKINKPLNKKYFEFWVNGKLMNDEVTIISPTKIFFHGLRSLRNLEIIEINRDFNEYFSDSFIEVYQDEYGMPNYRWNFDTYIDDALTGTLDGDNYTLEEQKALLYPVWPQVDKSDPNYVNYPENQDLEPDILMKVDSEQDLSDITALPYQFAVVNLPSIEGVDVSGRFLNFDQFGFIPMDESMIVSLINEEWAEEIEQGLIPTLQVLTDDQWYGVAARLYDEYGNLVHTLNEASYKVIDENLLKINTTTKLTRIIHSPRIYDLD